MLDDMPKNRSGALVARPEDSLAHDGKVGGRKLAPAKRGVAKAKRGWRREKLVKPSALGMLLQPIGVSLALVLSAYALLSLGVTFWRSYQNHQDHTAAVH